MNLREEVLKEHSRANADRIAAWVGNDRKRFGQLIESFLHDEYRVVQRTAHIISIIADAHPALVQPHLTTIVKRMQDEGVPVAVKRNVVRILQQMDIPEELHGDVMNTCFDFVADPKETIAVRAFSMTVLANLSKSYPDIKQELRAIIEDALEQDVSAGFKSRANKTLAFLNKK